MAKAKARTLDMSKADSGGKFAGKIKRYPEGDYEALITSVEEGESESGNDQWIFALKVKSGLFPYYCPLTAKTLWKVRNLFDAAGLDVPSKKAKIDPNELVGEKVAVTLEDDEYEDKVKSKIQAVFPLEEMSETADDDEEEEKPRKKKTEKKKAKRAVDEDEDDEEEEEEEEEPPKKKKKAKRATEEEDDEEEEDEEEEEEPPRKKKKAKKKKDEDEDLEEIDEDDV